jgi:hypothetical protein
MFSQNTFCRICEKHTVHENGKCVVCERVKTHAAFEAWMKLSNEEKLLELKREIDKLKKRL